MKKTDDAIIRSKAILEKRREELRKEYNEAYMNYSDTGYEKYYNKMEKCDEDMEILDGILNAGHRVALAEYNCQKAQREKEIFKKKLSRLAEDYPGDEYVGQICDRIRGMIISAEVEAK